MNSTRLNVTLDDEHAARLTALARRMHVAEGTLARSLLSSALEEADPDAENLVRLLDGIPGARDAAREGWEQAQRGETVPLDDLA